MPRFPESFFEDLKNRKMTDCLFEFDEDNTKKTLAAHKNVLGTSSPVLKQMLFGALKETDAIQIPDISFKVFEMLLWLIYDHGIELTEPEDACGLYYAGAKYDIPAAVSLAKSFILKSANLSNASLYYDTGRKFDDLEIKSECDKIFTAEIVKVSKTSNFFENMEPVGPLDDAVEDNLKLASQACKRAIEEESDREQQFCKALKLTRYHAVEAKNALALVVPQSELEIQPVLKNLKTVQLPDSKSISTQVSCAELPDNGCTKALHQALSLWIEISSERLKLLQKTNENEELKSIIRNLRKMHR